MPFVVDCPECDQKFRVREEFSGRRFRCPKCGEINEIDAIEVEAPEPLPLRKSDDEVPVQMMLPPVATPVKKRRKPVEDEKPEIDYELLGGRVGVLGARDDEEDAEQQKVMRQITLGFGGLLALLIICGIVVNRWNNSPDRLIPKEYETYEFKQGEFLVDVPKGWEIKARGGSNGIPATLVLEGPKVKFLMRENPRGTIVGGTADVLGALAGGLNEEDTAEGVHVAHMAMGQMITNEYVGYEETPPKVIRPTGFGSARICEYQGGNEWGMTEYGFRATVKTGMVAYRILIQMPDWLRTDFEPAARKIIASMRPAPLEELGFDIDEPDDPNVDEAAAEPEFKIDPFTGEKIPVEANPDGANPDAN